MGMQHYILQYIYTETNKLMYTIDAVILERLDYKMNNTRSSKGSAFH